jgi:hypothetical protein
MVQYDPVAAFISNKEEFPFLTGISLQGLTKQEWQSKT